MKKLELKKIKISTLTKDSQDNINGGKAPGTLVDSHCKPFYTRLQEIPDAPGGPCRYDPIYR